MARFFHHQGRDAMLGLFNKYWFNTIFGKIATRICQTCAICQEINIGKRVNTVTSSTGKSAGPFSRIQCDFMELPPVNKLRYVLVIVCLFSRWVEAYPTRRSDSMTVAKLLLREIIPRFGAPMSIETDRGSHFRNEIMDLICTALQIIQRFHCPYRLQ